MRGSAGITNGPAFVPNCWRSRSPCVIFNAAMKPKPIAHLGPAAKRMARKSVSRLSDPLIARGIRSLRQLLQAERQCKLGLGDSLVKLIDRHHLRPIDIARAVDSRANHLSEMYHVCRIFPPAIRKPLVPYTHYWMAMRAVRRFKELNLDPLHVLSDICKHGFSQHRQVTAHFASKLRKEQNASVMAASTTTAGAVWFNRCYHARFQTLINVFPDRSIKVLHIDPPYANYRRLANGSYSGGSMTSTECDGSTGAEAIELTIDMLREWGPKLKPGGVLLLWQASGPLRQPIADAIEQHGWSVETVVI
jgi:hypothetical protein